MKQKAFLLLALWIGGLLRPPFEQLQSYAHAAEALTLVQAIAMALDENHELRAAAHSLAAERENIGVARSYLWPKISLEERSLRTNNPTYGFMAKLNQERFTMQDFAINSLNDPDAISDYQSSVSLEQPLFAPTITIGLAMAETAAAAKENEVARKKEEVSLQVARMFHALDSAREYVAVADKGVENRREHLRIANLRYKNDLGLYSDTLRAATALSEAEQQAVSARKNFQVAGRALGLLLGRTEQVAVAREVSELSLKEQAYYLTAVQERADLLALAQQHENAKLNVRLTRANFLPSVGIGSSYQMNDHARLLGDEGQSWQIMGFMKWEMVDGGRRQHEKTRAQYQVNEAAEYLAAMKKAAAFQVQEALLSVEETATNLELARTALQSAEECLRLVQVRYENSLSPMVDLLDAQVAVDRARANQVARRNDHSLALINVSFVSGTLLRDLGVPDVRQAAATPSEASTIIPEAAK